MEPQGLRGIAASPGSASPSKHGTRQITGEAKTAKSKNGHATWNSGQPLVTGQGHNQNGFNKYVLVVASRDSTFPSLMTSFVLSLLSLP